MRPIDAVDDDADEDEEDEEELEEETEETEGHRLPCESTRYRRAISGVSETRASR